MPDPNYSVLVACKKHLTRSWIDLFAHDKDDAMLKAVGQTTTCRFTAVPGFGPTERHSYIVAKDNVVTAVELDFPKITGGGIGPAELNIQDWQRYGKIVGATDPVELSKSFLGKGLEIAREIVTAASPFTTIIFKKPIRFNLPKNDWHTEIQTVETLEGPKAVDVMVKSKIIGVFNYRFDMNTKFLEQARRLVKTPSQYSKQLGVMHKTRNSVHENAVVYLVAHAPGVNWPEGALLLGLKYFTFVRASLPIARLTTTDLERISKELDLSSNESERLTPLASTFESLRDLSGRDEDPKISFAEVSRGATTMWPITSIHALHFLTTLELAKEAQSLKTMKAYPTLTLQEEEQMIKAERERRAKQSIDFYLSSPP